MAAKKTQAPRKSAKSGKTVAKAATRKRPAAKKAAAKGAKRRGAGKDSLTLYNAKRDFSRTAEPAGKSAATGKTLHFVIQKHAASHLHFDLRLELDGVMKSRAVPKGPSYDPT